LKILYDHAASSAMIDLTSCMNRSLTKCYGNSHSALQPCLQ